MSIASALVAAQGRVADCYTAISNKGGTLPATQNLTNMPTAINSIPSGGSTKYGCTVDSLLGNVDANNKLLLPTISFSADFSGIEDLEDNALAYKFTRSAITSISFRDLKIISGQNALNNCCSYIKNNLIIDLSSLEEISGNGGIAYIGFNSCVTNVNLSKLKTVGTLGCNNSFSISSANDACLTSIDLSSLETVNDSSGCSQMLQGQVNLPETFNSLPKLKSISGNGGMTYFLSGIIGSNNYITSFSFPLLDTITGQTAMQGFFRYRTALQHIYFNSIKTTSFGSYVNQFNNLVNGITGCTIHLPSNTQTVISGLTGYPLFGGTNTVLAFDLPATEVDLTVNLTGNNNSILNGFTINGTTYPYSSFPGDGLNNTMTIKIPGNKNLSWTATCSTGTLTPSSGTINTSSNYTLNITSYDPSVPT